MEPHDAFREMVALSEELGLYDDPPRLPCTCPCHVNPLVRHVAPCCERPPANLIPDEDVISADDGKPSGLDTWEF